MTIIFQDGFEIGLVPPWSNVFTGGGVTVAIDTVAARTGIKGCKITGLNANVNFGTYGICEYILPVARLSLYSRVYVKFTQDIANGSMLYLMQHGAMGGGIFRGCLLRNTNGTYAWMIEATNDADTSNDYVSPTFSLQIGKWYSLELYVNKSAIAGQLTLWVDNVQVVNQTGLNTGALPLTETRAEAWLIWGANPNVGTIYFDDIVVADTHIGDGESNILFTDDFEGGLDAWIPYTDGAGFAPTAQGTTKYAGNSAVKCSVAGVGTSILTHDLGVAHSTLYCRGYVRFSALPTPGNFLLVGSSIMDVNEHDIACVIIVNDAGILKWGLRYTNDALTTIHALDTTGTPVAANIWYYVEVMATAGNAALYVNGTTPKIQVTVANSTLSPRKLQIGAWTPTVLTVDVYIDDIVASETYIGGTLPPSQNGYITVNAYQDSMAIVASVTLDGQSGTTPVTFTVPVGTYSLTATYQGQTLPAQQVIVVAGQTSIVNLHFALPVTHSLIITAETGGRTNPVSGRYDYNEGTSAVVTAIPDSDYRFSHWELDGTTRTENPVTIVMGMDYSLRAVFEALPPPPPQKRYLTIVAINGGQTNPTPNTYEVDLGSTMTITATPNSGYKFKEWLLDNVQTGTQPFITVTMDTNHTVVATFEEVVTPPPVQAGFPVWIIPVVLIGMGAVYVISKKK